MLRRSKKKIRLAHGSNFDYQQRIISCLRSKSTKEILMTMYILSIRLLLGQRLISEWLNYLTQVITSHLTTTEIKPKSKIFTSSNYIRIHEMIICKIKRIGHVLKKNSHFIINHNCRKKVKTNLPLGNKDREEINVDQAKSFLIKLRFERNVWLYVPKLIGLLISEHELRNDKNYQILLLCVSYVNLSLFTLHRSVIIALRTLYVPTYEYENYSITTERIGPHKENYIEGYDI